MKQTRPHALSKLGLKAHLDRTKGKHNGKDYDYFLQCLEFKMPKSKVAEAFDVEPPTIYAWIRQHEAEKNTA